MFYFEGTTIPPPVTLVAGHGWTLLLKGVAGVPGNLASLWNSPATMNEHVPSAQFLTNQYAGHYKPDLSNHWNECNFKQVKCHLILEGRKEMFYLTMHLTHFIYMASDIW